jgi:glycosyltransferase involved in cell wall biosynthesis
VLYLQTPIRCDEPSIPLQGVDDYSNEPQRRRSLRLDCLARAQFLVARHWHRHLQDSYALVVASQIPDPPVRTELIIIEGGEGKTPRNIVKFHATMPRLSERIRVLHILAPAREGGLERVVSMLSEGQGADRVHVAAVLSPDDADGHPFIARLKRANIPVTAIVTGARSYLSEYRLLGQLVAQQKPGIIHTHGYRADVIGGAVGRAYRVPTVSTVHGFTGSGKGNRFNERVQCFALRFAGAVIAVSRPLVETLTRAGVPSKHIRFISNGFAPMANMMTRADARQILSIRDNALTVGWVGRLSREKGADVMLAALAQSDVSWRLSIIGEGEDRERLKEQAADLGVGDRVAWHGAVANAGAVLPAFDCFVLSSRTEGTPIALFEAMAARVPIVATRVGGVPDVVTSEHALLVPTEQPGAIAAALAELRRDPSAATDRSELAHERVRAFSAEAWLEAIDEVYRTVSA